MKTLNLFVFLILTLIVFTLRTSSQTIHEAAMDGKLTMIESIVKDDSLSINAKNEDNETPLFYAAYGGHVEVVKFLIVNGGNVKAASATGETALHYAAYAGQNEIIRMLIDNKAYVGALTNDENTPLHYTAYRGEIEAAELLIQLGANVNALNHNGYTPMDLTELNDNHEMLKFFASKGGTVINIESPDVLHLSKSIYRILFPFGDVSNIGVSVGSDGLLLIDTGFSKRAVEELKTSLQKLDNGDVKFIINTHLHPDHIAGNTIADSTTIIINYNNLDSLATEGCLVRIDIPISGRNGKKFDLYYTLKFNGEEIRLIPYPGIHTDEDMLVHFTNSNVVHMGDLLISQSFPSVKQKADDYLIFLEKVISIFPETTTIICGHGKECTLEDVKKYHNMLSSAAEIIKQYLKEGKGKKEIRADKALENFKQWDNFIPVLNAEYWMNAVCNAYKEE